MCLFQVQWLTHSFHVITSWLTNSRFKDCNLNETCRELRPFQGNPSKKGYPHTKETLHIPFAPLNDYTLFQLLSTTLSGGLSILFSHATPLRLCMVLIHSKCWEKPCSLHGSGRCHFYNLRENTLRFMNSWSFTPWHTRTHKLEWERRIPWASVNITYVH